MEGLVVIANSTDGQVLRKELERHGLWDGSRRMKSISDTKKIAVPLKYQNDPTALKIKIQSALKGSSLIDRHNTDIEIDSMVLPLAKKAQIETPAAKLGRELRELIQTRGLKWTREVEQGLPDHWEIHGDLVLLPDTAFRGAVWQQIGHDVWPVVCQCLRQTRVARKTVISSDGFRTPQVELLYGTSGWVQHVDNKIRYQYDITKCMFSSGNITEKLRVANFNCKGETVVDLYSGIGYFTLPYLVHAGAGLVHACEWNLDAVTALMQNLKINGVEDRCVVHKGDNRMVCPRNVADRVNLGLVPSSEAGWFPACAALKAQSGGILHIHGNITDSGADNTKKDSGKNGLHGNMTDIPARANTKNKDSGKNGCHGNVTNTGAITTNKDLVKNGCQDNLTDTGANTTNTGVNTTYQVLEENGRPGGNDLGNDHLGVPGSAKNAICLNVNVENGSDQNCGYSSLKKPGINDKDGDHQCDLGKEEFSMTRNDTTGFSESFGSSTVESCPKLAYCDIPETMLEMPQKNKKKLVKTQKWLKRTHVRREWLEWANHVSSRIQTLLEDINRCSWQTEIVHIEHVKWYAPHVSHLVLDLDCRPSFRGSIDHASTLH